MNHPIGVELEIGRIRELLQAQRFVEGLQAAEALLVGEPESRDALYLQAVAQRSLGDIAAALATLTRLERLYPRFSGLYQERGYCYVALKRAPEAIEAFQHAVQ